MQQPTAPVPPEILRAVQAHISQMARAVARIDPLSPFWASLRESGLSFAVAGWNFRFSVEADKLVLADAQLLFPRLAS